VRVRLLRGLAIAAFFGLGFAQFVACGARTGLTNLSPDAPAEAAPPDTTAPIADVTTDPIPASRINGLSLGDAHSCARRADGTVACWGKNLNGQLGNGTMSHIETAPVAVVGLSDAVELSAAQIHTCARRARGTVVCWGDNQYGQLGNGTTTPSTVPVNVSGITDAVELVSGAFHFCARTSVGKVLCWGRNDFGQLGNGTEIEAHVPTAVPGLTAVALGAGDFHSCAVLADGSVECWGQNSNGQLGDTSLAQQDAPVAVKALTGALEVTAGVVHTCARTGGAVFCWGVNENGQLGYGLYDGALVGSLTPVDAMGVTKAVQIGAADNQTCARNGDGTVMCWGQNNQGQTGTSGDLLDTGNVLVPTAVVNLEDAVELAVGSEHTCARTRDDAVWCWGANGSGQLGDGTTTDEHQPTPVMGL
jgi:alpha-tubulin suppressor-like RCC1 family protein